MFRMKSRVLAGLTALFMLYSIAFPGLNFPGFPGMEFPGFPGVNFPGFPGLAAGEMSEDPRGIPVIELVFRAQDELDYLREVMQSIKDEKNRKEVKRLVKLSQDHIDYTSDCLQEVIDRYQE